MKKFYFFAVVAYLVLSRSIIVEGSRSSVAPERIRLVKEIQEKLNLSFRCAFSVSIGQTRKYATANSSGIIIVDTTFLQTANRGSIFFAIAHEYAHAYLQHDIQMYEQSPAADNSVPSPMNLVEVRRRFEKEADGIAARKAKQMGFDIDSIINFILDSPDPERGIPAESRVYSKPRERANYILAVYQSS
jgi:hypothetical protein